MDDKNENGLTAAERKMLKTSFAVFGVWCLSACAVMLLMSASGMEWGTVGCGIVVGITIFVDAVAALVFFGVLE